MGQVTCERRRIELLIKKPLFPMAKTVDYSCAPTAIAHWSQLFKNARVVTATFRLPTPSGDISRLGFEIKICDFEYPYKQAQCSPFQQEISTGHPSSIASFRSHSPGVRNVLQTDPKLFNTRLISDILAPFSSVCNSLLSRDVETRSWWKRRIDLVDCRPRVKI